MSDRGAAATLQAELTKKLRQHIDDAEALRADALRRDFAVLAEDYRTLQLMDELPGHADGAYSAWRQLAPELTDAVSRQQLLGILAEAYAQAGQIGGAR
ncbi:MAG: hypothetical protein AAGM16_05455 [Pseudomonadota bacterium]